MNEKNQKNQSGKQQIFFDCVKQTYELTSMHPLWRINNCLTRGANSMRDTR